jgi:hypothetical protein
VVILHELSRADGAKGYRNNSSSLVILAAVVLLAKYF